MAEDGYTRRRVLGAGLAATAGSALVPSTAAAVRRPALFELDLTGGSDPAAEAASAGWRTLEPRRAPRRFDLLGLRWAPGASPETQVRTRRDRGAWSAWLPLHAMGDHAPDAARGGRGRVLGTEPAWTDTADHFQLRLRGAAPGLRVRFVRAKPTAAVARSVTGRLARRAGAGARASQAPVAAGTLRPPRIVTRAEWGADSVPPRAEPDFGEVALAFVHHTVSASEYAPEDSAAIVLGIARYHRDSNKWNDIGYNFLVDKYGQVFEGRAGGMDLAVVGAHAQGFNGVSTGIACLGDFTATPQSGAGLAALADIVAWKLALHAVPPEGQVTVTSAGGSTNRYPSGRAVAFERISGHRDANATSCPGSALFAQIPALRAAVARRTPAAPPAAPGALTLTVAATRVRYPKAARVSGTLRFGDGSAPTGAPLELQFRARDGGWQPLAVARADAAGHYATPLEVPAVGPPSRRVPRRGRTARRRGAPGGGGRPSPPHPHPQRPPRPAGQCGRGERFARPSARRRPCDLPARAARRLALGRGPAQAHQRARRGVRDAGAAPVGRRPPGHHLGARHRQASQPGGDDRGREGRRRGGALAASSGYRPRIQSPRRSPASVTGPPARPTVPPASRKTRRKRSV
jgi:hypothetical protein